MLSTSVFPWHHSTSAQYFCVPLSVPFHHCSILLFSLSSSFHHFSVLLCSSVSIIPQVLSTPVFSVSNILPLPNTSVFHCQHRSIISQYFCVPLSASFHQSSVLQCFLSAIFFPCPILLCSLVSIVLAFLSTSVFLCQHHSTSPQYSCVSVSTILPLPSTSVFPCQHHSTVAVYFCVPLSGPFHQHIVLPPLQSTL